MSFAQIRQCTQCGATLELAEGALSTACAYCDAPTVDHARADAHLDAVAPFRINRAIATAKLQELLRGRFWAPEAVKSMGIDSAHLRGVLVPHWAVDGIVRSHYDARVGIYYYVTERYKDSSGRTQTRKRRKTEWFPLSGTAARQVENHVVTASVGLPESESNAIEPFDLGWALPVDPRLLSGFEAEIPSIARPQALQTAVAELRERERRRIEIELLPGDENDIRAVRSEVDVSACRAVLLPVWIGVYHHRDKAMRLLVNGQTGRAAGHTPVSWAKVTLAIVLGLAIAAAIGFWIWYGGQP